MVPGVELVRDKLRQAGIPDELHVKFIEFQHKYAGKESKFNWNVAVWGVLLEKVRDPASSAMVPGEIEAFEEDGVWQVVCADIHVSDTATIDQYGRLYWSYKPWYSDFNLFFENREPDLRLKNVS
jgi:hypothetical protein